MMEVLADVLERLVRSNDTQGAQIKVTKFHALRPPRISIAAYLERILRFANCSGECFVLALVYIDRLIRHQNFIICSLNIHRVIMTSITLAAKFFDDAFYNNSYYARIGGIPVQELNSLELEFLFLVNFTLHVSPIDYYRYQRELCEHARRSGRYPERVLPHCDVPEEELLISETDEELYSDSEAPPLPPASTDTNGVSSSDAMDEPWSGDEVEEIGGLPVPGAEDLHHERDLAEYERHGAEDRALRRSERRRNSSDPRQHR